MRLHVDLSDCELRAATMVEFYRTRKHAENVKIPPCNDWCEGSSVFHNDNVQERALKNFVIFTQL